MTYETEAELREEVMHLGEIIVGLVGVDTPIVDRLTPMYHLPPDDAPMREWVRPLSARLVTRRSSFFSDDDNAARSGAEGAMTQRLNKKRKRAANINMTEFRKLDALGVSVGVMALALGVSTRSVERAKRRRDG